MRIFHLITEADARWLPIGGVVTLAAGGRVTPLARDTLRERRVTVLSEILDADMASLAPPAEIRRVALGSDHSGVTLKSTISGWLRGQGLAVEDVGTHGDTPVDYPDIAAEVARLASSTAPGWARPSPRTRSMVCGRPCVSRRRLRGMHGNTTAQTCSHSVPL